MEENKTQNLDYQIHGIFPIPIYFTKLKKFTDMELKVVRSLENKSSKNLGNYRSKDSYILKSKHKTCVSLTFCVAGGVVPPRARAPTHVTPHSVPLVGCL